MIYTELTKKALKLCFQAHQNQTDKAGMPYVFHPFHLAEQMDTEEAVAVALLHDVIEDTAYTLEDLQKMNFPETVIQAVNLLTHSPEENYTDYLLHLKENPLARMVKLADLQHNSDLSRLDVISERDLKRHEKYQKANELLLS